jgi:ubiquitin carboxyl-terminal hydrolase 1
MNTRHGRSEILSKSPGHDTTSNSHYETALTLIENNPAIAYSFIAFISIFFLLDYFGFTPISLLQLSWDLLVYFTPSRIVVALDSRDSNPESIAQNLPFREKSNAMKRILGLPTIDSFPYFPRPRSLSALGSALLGTTKDTAPPGLGNWNNSCFQNSVIQGLASLKSLREFLGRNMDLSESTSLSTHQALMDLINSLNSSSNHGNKLWIAGPLKSMSSWQQQDAQEYFSKVVDQIDHEAEVASRGEISNLGLKMAGPEENIVHENSFDESVSEKNDSALSNRNIPPHNPLEGLLAQRVGCMECGYSEGLSLIPFNCLTVPLGDQYEYDIRDCLDQYMALEPIEGVECSKCSLLHREEQLTNLIDGLDEDYGNKSDSSETPRPFNAVKMSAASRLEEVKTALEHNDFSESTLAKKCHIPSKNRVSTTKSRQAVIARAPKCLTIHINRSVFDEMTGMLKKNHAAVVFPQTIDLNSWCLGTQVVSKSGDNPEQWETNPSKSMLPQPGESVEVPSRLYQLRAIITHYGRHENGHYICYRKYPTSEFSAPASDEILQAEGDKDKPERWWRLSDDDVEMVSEGHVMSQGGAFMLFYEAVDDLASLSSCRSAASEYAHPYPYEEAVHFGGEDTVPTPDDISAPSTVTDCGSSTSRATSVSMPSEEPQSTKSSAVLDLDTTPNGEIESTSTIVA